MDVFATSSLRLIPEGEKPETFTGLTLAPNEGRTVKGWGVDDSGEQTSKLRQELALLLENEAAASLAFLWCGMAAVYADAPSNTFTAKDGLLPAQRLRKLQATLSHIDGLIPLLDERLAWTTACYMPGMSDGPEVADENEQRVEALRASLVVLRGDVARAVEKMPPVQRGRSLELTPRLMLTIGLISQLKEAGIPMGTGERSKMVRAVRVCWDAVNFDGDPRDLLRSLEKKGAQIGETF